MQSWSIRALSANERKYLAPKEASECFDLVRLLSEVPHIWTCLDRQSGQYLGNVSKQLRTQMRQFTTYLEIRWPMEISLHSGNFAQKMALFSTMQPTLHTLILSRYAMSAQNIEELIGCEWPKLQFLKIRLCTATMEECCSAIATLADGHWPSLNELHIIHKAVPRFYSRSGEAAIRLYLRGRWPDSGLFVASDFWPTKDGSCQHTHRQMVFDAAPGDEYRDMLLQSACRCAILLAPVSVALLFAELTALHTLPHDGSGSKVSLQAVCACIQ